LGEQLKIVKSTFLFFLLFVVVFDRFVIFFQIFFIIFRFSIPQTITYLWNKYSIYIILGWLRVSDTTSAGIEILSDFIFLGKKIYQGKKWGKKKKMGELTNFQIIFRFDKIKKVRIVTKKWEWLPKSENSYQKVRIIRKK
jgi:hypothetical protein